MYQYYNSNRDQKSSNDDQDISVTVSPSCFNLAEAGEGNFAFEVKNRTSAPIYFNLITTNDVAMFLDPRCGKVEPYGSIPIKGHHVKSSSPIGFQQKIGVMTSRLPLEEWLDEDQPTTYKETLEVLVEDSRCKPKLPEDSVCQSIRSFNSKNYVNESQRAGDLQKPNVGKNTFKCMCGMCNTSDKVTNCEFNVYHSPYQRSNDIDERSHQTDNRHGQRLDIKQNYQTMKHKNYGNHHHLSTNPQNQQNENGPNLDNYRRDNRHGQSLDAKKNDQIMKHSNKESHHHLSTNPRNQQNENGPNLDKYRRDNRHNQSLDANKNDQIMKHSNKETHNHFSTNPRNQQTANGLNNNINNRQIDNQLLDANKNYHAKEKSNNENYDHLSTSTQDQQTANGLNNNIDNRQRDNRPDQHLDAKENYQAMEHKDSETLQHILTNQRNKQTTIGLKVCLDKLNKSPLSSPSKKDKKKHVIKSSDESGRTVEKSSRKKKSVRKSVTKRCFCEHCEEIHKQSQNSECSSPTDQEHSAEEFSQSREDILSDETISNQATVGSISDITESSDLDGLSGIIQDNTEGFLHCCNRILRGIKGNPFLLSCLLLFVVASIVGNSVIVHIVQNRCRNPPPRINPPPPTCLPVYIRRALGSV